MSYIPSTPEERLEMLRAVGAGDFADLYRDVPPEALLRRPLDLPQGMSELEVGRAMQAIAAKNRLFPTVLRGAGAYDHFIPAVVRAIPAKEDAEKYVYVNVSGVWKKAVPYVNVSGTWKQTKPYINASGVWKEVG